ncbi:MAG: spore coat protein CotJB [Clostridiaceae bacterium]|nr:spore coat protein CotJB [Clostridiaceae bacterium]
MSILDECCKTGKTLAMASVPMQEWCEPFDWYTALANGTIFPCLNFEFYKAQKIPCSICNKEKQSEHVKKFNEINVISFAINDLTLYLDTHPDCEKGLTLFKELLQKRLELLSDYAEEYNPLTQFSIASGTPDICEYSWSEGPMPWEGGHI